mgnify:FL=1
MTRKCFEDLNSQDYPQHIRDGIRIYKELKELYPQKNTENLDNILNALCASIIILVINNVEKDNLNVMKQVIWKILDKNL